MLCTGVGGGPAGPVLAGPLFQRFIVGIPAVPTLIACKSERENYVAITHHCQIGSLLPTCVMQHSKQSEMDSGKN